MRSLHFRFTYTHEEERQHYGKLEQLDHASGEYVGVPRSQPLCPVSDSTLYAYSKKELWDNVCKYVACIQPDTDVLIRSLQCGDRIFMIGADQPEFKASFAWSDRITTEDAWRIQVSNLWDLSATVRHPALAYVKESPYDSSRVQVYLSCSDSPSGVMLSGGGNRADLPAEKKIVISGPAPQRGDIAAKRHSI